MLTSKLVRLLIPLEMALVKGNVSVTIASVLYANRSRHECDFYPCCVLPQLEPHLAEFGTAA